MPIDYSKWKDIEISDDEDDTHPNVDTPSLFRWRHQARLERMVEHKRERDELEIEKTDTQRKVEHAAQQLQDTCLDESKRKEYQEELDKYKAQEDEWRKKEEDIKQKETLAKWNVDTIGHEAWSKSRINKVDEKKSQAPKMTTEEESRLMREFYAEHEADIERLSRMSTFDDTAKLLMDKPSLCNEWTANHMTIDALNAGIEQDERSLAVIARQTVTMQYLLELAKQLKAKPDSPTLIEGFFRKIKAAEQSYMKMYEEEVQGLVDRVHVRAAQKREEAAKLEEEEEKQERIKQSPGGLDPMEVFESLPKVMQEAFEKQDIGALQQCAADFDESEFQRHLQRCIDSGLWVPDANKAK